MQNFKLPCAYFPIEKEELLPKYFSRTSAIAHHDILTRGWYAPSGLDRYIEPFKDIIGPFEELCGYNTFLPLQLRMTTPEQADMIVRHTRYKYAHGIMAPLGMNGPNGGRFRVLPTMCPDCAQSDIASCGTPFWNRANMVPGLLFCSVHERPLAVACNECAVDGDHNRLVWPGQHCGCGLTPLDDVSGMSTSQQEHEMELHRVAKLLLNPEYMRGLTRDAIGKAAQQRSRELGLVDSGAKGLGGARNFFAQHRMVRLLERVGIVSTAGIATERLDGAVVYLNPLQSIALLMSLFDSWGDVEAKVAKIQNGGAGRVADRKVSKKKNSGARSIIAKRHTEKKRTSDLSANVREYVALRLSLPHFNHHGLHKLMGHTRRFLPGKELLRAAGVELPTADVDAERSNVIDLQISKHVTQEAIKLRLKSCPGIITRNRLLAHTVLARDTGLMHRFPLTVAALSEAVESAQEWRVRVGLSSAKASTEIRARSNVRRKQSSGSATLRDQRVSRAASPFNFAFFDDSPGESDGPPNVECRRPPCE
ncbi:hypothetical protein ACPWR0_14440 [Pandoraea pneumonica]|uniref:hypothetical protein n=1 Tax=Pandoraea pneumonica TaxID=2508299 RepID=UPI003CEDBB7A